MATANLDVRIAATDAFSPTMGKFNSLLSGLGSVVQAPMSAIGGLTSALGNIGLAAQGAASIVDGMKSAFGGPIMAASDLGEAINKIDVVFGASSESVKAFASSASTALGQSNSQALGALGTFGNLFVSMGMGQTQAADMSTSLVTLASDLASFNNIDPTEALEKLRSGLVGETEPLRSLGVNLSAAAVEAQALAETHKASAKELTVAEKAHASYSLILQQTTTAQGDFQRTSAGFANSQRIIKAQFADLQAQVGAGFLPTIEQLTGVLSQMLPGALASMSGPLQTAAGVFQSTGQEVLSFIAMVQNIAADHGLGAFDATLTALEIRIQETFGDNAATVFHAFVDLAGLIGTAVQALSPVFDLLYAAMTSVVTTIIDLIAWFVSGSDTADALGAVIVGITAAFVAYEVAMAAAAAITLLQTGYTAALEAAQAALNFVLAANPIGIVVLALVALTAALVYAYETNETFRAAVDGAWQTLQIAVITAVNAVVTAFNDVMAFVKALPATFSEAARNIGTAIIDGIRNGVSSAANALYDQLRNIAQGALNAAKSALGVHSPSLEFRVVGKAIGDGLTLGVQGTQPTVNNAVANLVRIPTIAGGGATATGGGATAVTSSEDNRPVIIQLDGQVIARTTWAYLKRANLQGANLGFA